MNMEMGVRVRLGGRKKLEENEKVGKSWKSQKKLEDNEKDAGLHCASCVSPLYFDPQL